MSDFGNETKNKQVPNLTYNIFITLQWDGYERRQASIEGFPLSRA